MEKAFALNHSRVKKAPGKKASGKKASGNKEKDLRKKVDRGSSHVEALGGNEVLELLETSFKELFKWKTIPPFSYFGHLDSAAEQNILYLISCFEQEGLRSEFSGIAANSVHVWLEEAARIQIKVPRQSGSQALNKVLALRKKSQWLNISFSQTKGVATFTPLAQRAQKNSPQKQSNPESKNKQNNNANKTPTVLL